MHLAIDLGAGSGRALVGQLTDAGLTFDEVHRFTYAPRHLGGRLRWDMVRLEAGLRDSLARAHRVAAAAGATLASVGVDAWGVDYGLVDRDGALLEEPVSYRDDRTAGVMDAVVERLTREAIFARTGIQFLPFNTIYQLVAQVRDGVPPRADRLLMMPDLCHLLLSGSRTGEHTNASTTQLLDAATGRWADGLFRALDLPREIMPPLVQPGADLGALRPTLQRELGVGPVRVVAPATHDTASAVVGTPLKPGWAYISSGTWSLVGVERREPILTAEAAAANFTNEGGAAGTVRFLRNVMGLWLLEACRAEWADRAPAHDRLVADAAALPRAAGIIDVEDLSLLNPPSMRAAIAAQLAARGRVMPEVPAAVARVIFDSLAHGYARVIATIERLTGEPIRGIHVVGGGSRNAYLNQATADACGKPVLAGPVEATAAGNLIVQAVAGGRLASVAEGREHLARATQLRAFEPRPRG
jgi:rhamnulokinase